MSKRKNRSRTPNLPEETLARARQQAGLEPTEPETVETEEVISSAPVAKPEPVRAQTAAPSSQIRETSRRESRRRENKAVQYTARKAKPLTSEEIAELLENPTKEVSEDELKQQYSYVLADLRSMGVLAAVLMIGLVIVARFL
jgi:hypothetical protein